MNFRWNCGFVSLAILTGATTNAFSQTQAIDGNIDGYVTSADGAPLGHAHLRISNINTGFVREADTDDHGYYSVQLLPPGTYTVMASKPDFSTALRSNLLLTVGEAERVDLQLSVGDVKTAIEVNSNPPVVEVERTTAYSNVYTERDARNIPLAARNPLEFYIFNPLLNSQQNSTGGSGTQTPSVAFAGLGTSEYNVDGVSNNLQGGARNVVISGEAVAEYQTLVNPTAEWGRSTGAFLNTISRSGTNDWHASVYMFTKQKELASRPYLLAPTTPTPAFDRYNYGATIAGPVIHDRAFFFLNYERWVQDSPAISTFGGAQQAAIAQQIGLPLSEVTTWNNSFRAHTVTAKGDIVLNAKNRLALRYNMYNDHESGSDSGAVTRHEAPGFNDEPQGGTAQLVTIFSPSFLNEFRFLYSFRPVQQPTLSPKNPAVNISGVGTFNGNANGNYWYLESGYQIVDNVTWNKGRHTIKAGFELLPVNFQDTTANLNGTFSFATLQQYLNTVAGVTNTATGKPYSYTQFTQATGSQVFDATVVSQGYFVQDDIRVNPRLKVNVGLRYELFLRPGGNLNPAYPLTGHIPQQYDEIEPRLGVAWDPFGKGKTVIRAGYGIYHNFFTPQTYEGWERNNAITVKNVTVLPTDPGAPAFTLGPVPSVAGGTVATPNLNQFDPNLKDNMMQSWNLVAEKEVLPGYSLALSYYGARINHLVYGQLSNLKPTGAVLADGRIVYGGVASRIDPNVGAIRTISTTGTWQDYNAFLVTFTKRLKNGLSFQAGYQRQKISVCLDKATPMADGSCYNQGRMSFDQPNRFTATAVWEPKAHLENRALSAFVNGWGLSNTTMIQNGLPYSALSGLDLNGDLNSNDRVVGTVYDGYRMTPYVELDFRLTRNFKILERGKVEVYGEALNSTGNANITAVNTAPSTASNPFGAPSTAGIPRQFQLGFRASF
jgi:hypothetical protein